MLLNAVICVNVFRCLFLNVVIHVWVWVCLCVWVCGGGGGGGAVRDDQHLSDSLFFYGGSHLVQSKYMSSRLTKSSGAV